MLAKLIIVILIIFMVASLVMGLVFMMKDKGKGTRTVKALTARVAIWIVLLLFLVIGVLTGVIDPSNSLTRHQKAPEPTSVPE